MGPRAWTLSTLLGCCAWILHGLGAVTAVPVTTDGSFTVGTAFPMTTENEWPHTTERSATAADAETFPPWTEMDPVMATSEYSPSVPALGNETKALNTTQSNSERNSAAPNMATTAAAITTQHPAVTPEAAHDEPEVAPDVPLGTTPVLEDVKEDITTDLSTGTTSLHSTPPLAVTWVPQPTAGVTVLPSQGLTTAQGAVEEGVMLPEDIQGETSANSSGSSPDAGELLPTRQDGAVGGAEGINPEPAGETAPAGEESPLASESGHPGDAINGELSTASSSHLPAESPAMSGTVESPGKSSLLPGQAVSPDTSLTPSDGGDGDGDGQGVPGMSSDAPGSALPPAASRAPAAPEETEDTATSLPAPGAPTEAQSDTNLPVSATALPVGDVGAVHLASPSLQPAPWQTPTGEQPLLLPDALTAPTDTPSAPGAAHPAPEAGASTLPEADAAAQTPASPDLTAGPEAAVSPSLGESQPAGAPQEAEGLGTGLSSDSGAPSPAPFVPGGLAWPTAGIQGQGAEGAGDMAQAEGSGAASPYEDTQSDTSPPALQPSVLSPAENGDLLTGGTEDLANAELSTPSEPGDGTETGTGGAPALGQVSSSSSEPPSNAEMESDLSGPEGPGELPSESARAPVAVSPALGSVTGPVSEAQTPVSPGLSAAQGAPRSPSFGGSQPWETAAGAPGGAGLPGAQGPDTDWTSAWGTPSSAVHEPVGPPSPGLGDQPGTNVGLPAAAGQGASLAEPALEGAGSGIESEPSLSSTAGSGAAAAGMDQVPSAGSPSGIMSPSDVAASSVSRGDEAGPMSSAAPGPDSLSPASPEGEAGPGLGLVQGAESAGDVAEAENAESGNPNMETGPSAVSPQQDLTNTGELPAEETGDVMPAELSPPSALGDGTETGTGGAPALGQVSSPGPAPPSNAEMESDLSGPEGPGELPSESARAPVAVSPALGSVPGPVSEAQTPVSPDLSAAQGAPGSPSFGGSQPWETAAGAPGGAGLPGAQGPDTDSTSAWGTPSSAVHEPVGSPSPGLGDQPGTNVGLPAAEPALEGAGSGIESEPSLSSTAGSGAAAAGMDQVPSAGSPSGIMSPSDVAASSVSRGDEAGPMSSAAPGPDSLSPASPEGEAGPGLGLVQGAESAGDVAEAENAESGNPNMETGPSAVSPQQDLTNTGELPAEETGDVVPAELSPPSALGDGTETGTGGAPALGQVSSPGPAPPSNAEMESDLSGPEGPGELPSESARAPVAVSPALGSVPGPVSEAQTPVSPDLSAAQGAPRSPSFGGSQPWGTAAGAPGGAGLPGAQGPDTDWTSAWGTPSSAVHEPVGPPSPGLGDQPGTNVGLPAAAGQGASLAEPALEGAGSGIESEPSLSSTAGSGAAAAGMDQVPSAGSPSGIMSPSDVAASSVSRGDEAGPMSSAAPGPDSLSPASPEGEAGPGLGLVQGAESAGDVAEAENPESGNPNMETSPSAVSPQQGELPGAASSSGSASPSGDVAASSVSDPSSLGALGDTDNAAEGVQPALGAATGVLPAAGEGASEGPGDVGSTGQSQAPTGMRPAGSESLDGEMGGVLQSASSSSSTEGSSSPGRTGEAADGKGLPGATAAGAGLNTGLEAAGPQEASVSVPDTQSGANTELSNGKPSEVNVVQVPGGALVNGGPSPGASLVPVAPDNSGVSNGMTTSVPGSLLLPGQGLSSGLAPSGDPNSAPSTQSGSSPLLPGSPGGLPEAAGAAHSWSLEDEVASGMPAPLGESSPRAPTSPNAAPVLPSAPQRGNSAEGASASPGPLARESIVGSSAGGKGELGAALPGGAALLLPSQQLGSPGAPSEDADSPAPGEGSAVLQGTVTGQGDVTHLLPGAQMETHSPPGGSPGLLALPPSEITAGKSPGAKTLGPGPAGGSLPAALQPPLGRELTTSLANRAPATSGSSFAGAFPGRGGSQGGSPATARPATTCSPAPAPAAPLPRGREVLPRPGTATVTSRASSPVVPAPPGVPAAAPTLLPSPTVPAVPLYGYGARENDQEYVERRVDFNSPLFKPETGFPFGKTLRSSLYFTDNGQIIFPASDNNILTYPNPPPSGFNGHEEVPMIAVFWDDADFSRGVGTTFYQEFSTLNTAKPPFVRDVEAKVRRYLRSSYSAAWTLKITWEKAPVHTARTDTRKTITYQAVLTTDGFRSYILMLYQDGGMQWDYTRLTSTNVLIGYTSGDGFYHNDDLTKRPPAAKYRPDQFRGYNTDLRGLWIYKLESRVGINYRLKCLAWMGQQQEPRAWSQGLPTCPCSLQQGQQDPRFKSSRGGRWGARVSMLHSASPNQHGAGVRCLYDSQDQLIEGRQERYWRNSRQASPYRDQELKLYDWCCNRAGSAHLCARYSEKRPKIGCDGYQSPSMDSSEEAENDSDEQIDGEDK